MTDTTLTPTERAGRLYGEKTAASAYVEALATGDDLYAAAIRRSAVEHGWTSIVAPVAAIASQTDEEFRAIVDGFQASTETIRDGLAEGKLTAKGAEALADNVVPALVTRLDVAIAKANVFIDAGRRALDLAVRSLTAAAGDTNEQLLTEMRIGRAWDRVKAELDAVYSRGDSVLLAMLERLQRSDQYELAALLTEAQSYLTAHREDDKKGLIRQTLKTINPAVAEAAENLQHLENFQVFLVHDSEVVRSIVTDPSLVVPDLAVEGYLDLTTADYTK